MVARKSGEAATDALSLLREDHARVVDLFDQFEQMKNDVDEQEKDALVARICGELIVHTAIEEEIFYPEAREALGEDPLFDEATVEHASAKDLIAQLGEMEPDDELYDAKVTVLGEYVKHHIREEESEMLARLADAGIDLDDLGRRLDERKTELMDEIGLDDLEALLPQGANAHSSESQAPLR
ncbi:MAG: hemerythrin domain-containing protein [Pseudomonadota bacterium]|nr:hemerythrin domain-containing protein [Pseudomonadota bacterium]